MIGGKHGRQEGRIDGEDAKIGVPSKAHCKMLSRAIGDILLYSDYTVSWEYLVVKRANWGVYPSKD